MSLETHREIADAGTRAALAGAARAAQDPHRLAYHFMAPSGWMNDPNGLIQFGGAYHLFYQHNPYAPWWGAMHWGHATSADLVHWEHLPVALAPSEPYERPEGGGGGCFSGSAVDDGGRLTLVYTGTGQGQFQCVATTADGREFSKHPGNPVIAEVPPDGSQDFRDPKVWRHDDLWHMVVGSGRDGVGKALLYRSRDLRRWEYRGVVARSDGTQGRVWECPDLFPLGGRHVLVCSPIGLERPRSICIVGEMDYAAGRFAPGHQSDADCGPGFYAPQTFLDDRGRRIMFGWMRDWEGASPSMDYGRAGALTLPRLVALSPEGGLRFTPVPELKSLRGKHERLADVDLDPGSEVVLEEVCGDTLEIKAEFEPGPGREGQFGIAVRCSPDGSDETPITCDRESRQLLVDWRRSGLKVAAPVSAAPLDQSPRERLKLHVFVDRSSVEVFVNDGRAVVTGRVYPGPDSLGVKLFARGCGASLAALDAWTLGGVW